MKRMRELDHHHPMVLYCVGEGCGIREGDINVKCHYVFQVALFLFQYHHSWPLHVELVDTARMYISMIRGDILNVTERGNRGR